MSSLRYIFKKYNLPLIDLFTVNNYYLPLMKLFIVNNNNLPLIKILTVYCNFLTVNDISLTRDKTIKSHLLVFKTFKTTLKAYNIGPVS